ncbi:hypothetical protein DIPPA_23462 [Diplonema papillatum]|nr:hypothetical protein DIPPA_23462 [Diplonema papillatum]
MCDHDNNEIKMRVLAVAFAAAWCSAAAAAAQNRNGCAAEDYGGGVEYFPQRTRAGRGAAFSVSYGRAYKNVTVRAGGAARLYQLVQCFERGRPGVPEAALPRCSAADHPPCSRFSVPLRAVAAARSFVGFLEEIEAEATVRRTDAAAVCPCVRANAVVGGGGGLRAVDAYFADSDSAIPGTDHPEYPKYIRVAASEETTAMARAEWVEFAALFYNRESLANYVVERAGQSYGLQRRVTGEVLDVLWIDALSERAGVPAATVTSDAYLNTVASDARLRLVQPGAELVGTELQTALKAVTAVIINGDTLDQSTALSRLGVDEPESYGFFDAGAVRVYQLTRYGAPYDENMPAAPDLLLSDLLKATRDDGPWFNTTYRFLRRVDELETEVSSDKSTCGAGVVRAVDPNAIRQYVISRLVAATTSNPTGTVQYKARTDYFPNKFYPASTSAFTISYHLTWKMVRSRLSNEIYILVQNGTEAVAPNIHVGDKRFTIPVRSTAYQMPAYTVSV